MKPVKNLTLKKLFLPFRPSFVPGILYPALKGLHGFNDMHEGTVVSAFFELNGTVSQCKKRKIPSDTHIVARVEAGTPLPDNDVARLHHLAAESFYT